MRLFRSILVAMVASTSFASANPGNYPPNMKIAAARSVEISAVETYHLYFDKVRLTALESRWLKTRNAEAHDRYALILAGAYVFGVACKKDPEISKAVIGVIHANAMGRPTGPMMGKLADAMGNIHKTYEGRLPSFCSDYLVFKAEEDARDYSIYSIIEQISRHTIASHGSFAFLDGAQPASELDKSQESRRVERANASSEPPKLDFSIPTERLRGLDATILAASEKFGAVQPATFKTCVDSAKALDASTHFVKLLRDIRVVDAGGVFKLVLAVQREDWARRWEDHDKPLNPNMIFDKSTYFFVCDADQHGRISKIELYKKEWGGQVSMYRQVAY